MSCCKALISRIVPGNSVYALDDVSGVHSLGESR
jgi:hypothetical protein